ncbi:MAG: TolC family protein [Acidobacteriota bacterium]
MLSRRRRGYESYMETTAIQAWITLRRAKTRGVKLAFPFVCAGLALCLFLAAAPARGQQKIQGRDETPPKSESEPARLRTQLAEATREYQANLEKLAALYEADAKLAEGRLQKMKELYAQGLITRREMETSEDAAARARDKYVDAQAQLKGADVQLAEALIEVEAEETAPKLRVSAAPRAVRGLVHTTAYIRYGGGRAWSLSEAGAIKQFFIARFGRPLPIHVFGQSPLHDRWHYDHHNAMDIGLNPDSREGQALVEYLRANGVPFTAFHFAIPGVATGPHIHVGFPSHRITATVASK